MRVLLVALTLLLALVHALLAVIAFRILRFLIRMFWGASP